jgi:hypothetical protein
MRARVVMITPSQGTDCDALHNIAQLLAREVYPNCVILKTHLDPEEVAIGKTVWAVHFRWGRQPFSWDALSNLKRVLVVSHGMLDGPNLAHWDDSIPDDAKQPWGFGGGKLTEAGRTFWTMVSRRMQPDGFIMLLGCLMAAGHFAANLSALTGRKVYGAGSDFPVAIPHIAKSTVRDIEAGHLRRGFVSYDRSDL